MSEFNPQEQNQANRDHDLLIRMDTKLDSLIVSHIEFQKKYEVHILEDVRQFAEINRKIYIGMGAILVIIFIVKLVFKV